MAFPLWGMGEVGGQHQELRPCCANPAYTPAVKLDCAATDAGSPARAEANDAKQQAKQCVG